MANLITVPPPEEIKHRIEQRQEEIRSLKKLYRLSLHAQTAQEFSESDQLKMSRADEGGDNGR